MQQNKKILAYKPDLGERMEYLHLTLTLFNQFEGTEVYAVNFTPVLLAGHDRKSGRCKLASDIAELSC